jgi:hypothetical protein
MGTERAVAAWTAAGTGAALAIIALVDPNRPGHYPTCPTRLVLDLDCPACGTLRGLHALSQGDVASALDHNILLLAAVPLGAWIWLRWVRTAITGRPAPAVSWPRWVAPAMIGVAVVFTVTRNLAIPALTWLDAA